METGIWILSHNLGESEGKPRRTVTLDLMFLMSMHLLVGGYTVSIEIILLDRTCDRLAYPPKKLCAAIVQNTDASLMVLQTYG